MTTPKDIGEFYRLIRPPAPPERIPGICTFDPASTIWSHARWGAAALCPKCHQEIDSGNTMSKQERREAWLDAHIKTISELFAAGRIRPA